MTSNSKVDPAKYLDFVNQVTSDESKDGVAFVNRLRDLEGDDCEIHRLLTAAVGISAEGGEFMEIVKKIIFQGKPYNTDNVFHMKRELGDIMWYLAQACMALDTDFDELMAMNVEKLGARYPEGTFDVHYSENRKAGDL